MRSTGEPRIVAGISKTRLSPVLGSRVALWAGLIGAVSLVVQGPGAGEAVAGPMLVANAGGTAAVLGEPNGGGASLGLAALWPFDPYFAFGPARFADDLGTGAGRLADPNDHTDLGAVAGIHREAVGGAWRLDAWLPVRGPWSPYASGTWGIYHVTDDFLGTRTHSLNSTGWSLGAGLDYRFGNAVTVGPSVRYHRLFNDRVGRYIGIGLDVGWRLGP